MSKKTTSAGSDLNSSLNVKQYFAELQKCERIRDFERGLKAANRILKVLPEDKDALLCKIVCLVHDSKFDDALQLIKRTPSLAGSCYFEKAYCEYRLNRTEESLATLRGVPEGSLDLRCQELFAQLLYRKECYDECYKMYQDLMRNSQDEYEEERHTNLAAIVACLHGRLKNLGSVLVDEECYEQCYNEACRLLTNGDFHSAKLMLTKAAELCRQTLLEEGAGDEEIEEELSLIRTQQAYVEQQLGQADHALQLYSDVLKKRPSDISVIAVASNNFVSIKKDQNLFESRKKMKACQSSVLDQKLTSNQLAAICINNALLQLHSNQLEPCRRSIAELRERFGQLENACLLEAALACRERQPMKAVDLLTAYIQSEGKASAKSPSWNCSLALAQLLIGEGKLRRAYDTLIGIDGFIRHPAALSLCAAICLANEDKESAAALLTEAIRFYKANETGSVQAAALMEQLASLYLNAHDYTTATDYLEQIRALKADDPRVLGRLIKAYSQYDAKKAAQLSKELADLNKSSNERVDVDSLEDSSWMVLGGRYGVKKSGKVEMTPKASAGDALLLKKKFKRKRKKRLPKNFDPNVPPDPERWIPRYERAEFRKKKTKRQRERDIGRGTQGAAIGGQELDSSIPKAETPTSPKHGSSAGPSPAQTSSKQTKPIPGNSKAKKKSGNKKGIKW